MVIWRLVLVFVCSCVISAAPGEDSGHGGDARAADPLVVGAWPLPATIVARVDVPDVSDLDAWSAQLKATVDDINFGIRAISSCPDLFVVGATGDHEIWLTRSCDGLEPNLLVGQEAGPTGMVFVRGEIRPGESWQTSALRGSIAHALGHAAGLGHASPLWGASAMTSPPPNQMYARDVAEIACRMGCGACDPDRDPYSGL